MNPRPARGPSRRGSVTPVVLLLVGIFFVGFLVLYDQVKESILLRRGQAAAEAVAVNVLATFYPLRPSDNPPDPASKWPFWADLARGNGVSESNFLPFTEDNINVEPLWVEVVIEALDPGLAPIGRRAEARWAGRIGEGRLYPLGPGAAYPVGCLPLGIQAQEIPQPPNTLELHVGLAGPTPGAAFVILGDPQVSPADGLQFLQIGVPGPPLSLPTAAVEVGDQAMPVSPTEPLLLELDRVRELGRPQVVPLLDGTAVVGLGLIELAAVEGLPAGPPPGMPPLPPAIRIVLAPSAVVPGAKASWRPAGNPPTPDVPDSLLGLVLRPQVDSI